MAKEPSSMRLIVALAITGLFSGVVLSGIFSLTYDRIQQNRADAIQKAIKQVLPGVFTARTYILEDGVPKLFEGDGVPVGDAIYEGLDEKDRVVGYAIPAKGPGFMDTVKVLYGYKPKEKTIVGLAILESRETPGLGDKIGKDPVFLECFKNLLVIPEIAAIKDNPTERNQVDTISGATISSKAVINLLNKRVKELSEITFPNHGPEKEF